MRRLILGSFLASLLAPSALVGQSPSVELLLGGITMPSKRNAAFLGSVGTASGSMSGGEFVIRGKPIGLAARYLTGDFAADSGTQAAGKIELIEARLVLGPRAFGLEGGGVRRTLTTSVGTATWYYVRAGIRSQIAIGASGFHATFAGAYYPFVKRDGVTKAGGKGYEAETALMYARKGIPVYIQLGYRFQSLDPDNGSGSVEPDEISGVVISAGLRLAK